MNITNLIQIILFKFGTNNIRISIARKWGVRIGKGCTIYSCNFGSEPYLVSIGNNCEITSGVKIITHDGATWVFRKNKKFTGTKLGLIIIRENSIVGLNTIILPNVEIGPNSIVGAGSIVTKNIPPNSVYAGNPAKFICTLDQYLENCKIKDTGMITSKNKKNFLLEKFEKDLNKLRSGLLNLQLSKGIINESIYF